MITYLLENCPKCGEQPKLWYDSEEFNSLYNIKCCDIHIHTYRSVAFKKWNEMIKYKVCTCDSVEEHERRYPTCTVEEDNLLSTSKHFCCHMTTDGSVPDTKNCFGANKGDKVE